MPKQFRLSEKELEALAFWERVVKKHHIHRKLTALRMKHNGANNTEIGRLLNVSRESVRRWINTYSEGGVVALTQNNYRRPRSALGLMQWLEIKEAHREWPFRNSLHLKHYVEHEYNLSFNKNYLKQQARERCSIRFRSPGAPAS